MSGQFLNVAFFNRSCSMQPMRGNDLMKKYITILTLLLLPVLALGGAQQIEPQISPNVADSHGIVDESPNSWFVELASNPAAEGTSKRTLKKRKSRLSQRSKESWAAIH
jgi:hypothetical protein